MCGIIAIMGREPAAPRMVESLRRLEYRGYDSAGLAVLGEGAIARRRAPGKLKNLEAALAQAPLPGDVGIGHTRWATHGGPTEANAHPHVSGRVALVHNGIIENFAELKAELAARGRSFSSETDSEVVAQLIDAELETGLSPHDAFKAALARLRGAYALAVLVAPANAGGEPVLLGARLGPPLVVGHGEGEMFIGSDPLAVAPYTRRVTYLEDGDHVVIDHDGAAIFDSAGSPVERPVRTVAASTALLEKGNHRHFMEKEIHEQPDAVQHTLSAYVDPVSGRAVAPGVDFKAVPRLQIVACGTAYLAGLTAKYLFERLAGLPVDVEIASEFRYRDPAVTPGTLALAISQSGETADTLAALRWCKARGLATAAVVNAHHSSMAREADVLWPTHAGPEIGVASTKAFTAQLSALTALAVAAAYQRGAIDAAADRAGAAARGRGAGARPRPRAGPRRALPRPRPAIPPGVGGGAEAEGTQLHPRRRLRSGRAEARPDRAGGRAYAGGRGRPGRRLAGEEALQPAGGGGARRLSDHPGHRRRRRPQRARGDEDDPDTRLRSARRTDGLCRADPAPGLPCCSAKGYGRGPAAKPGQVRHGRVSLRRQRVAASLQSEVE